MGGQGQSKRVVGADAEEVLVDIVAAQIVASTPGPIAPDQDKIKDSVLSFERLGGVLVEKLLDRI